ncbi:MAG: anaerobic ribonucleoside-triphosphate reductase activating protein [Opitutales bacterium]|nr:anaerobic ribonucleoside-triphosphate reductase activating protein [Opitutales bacterium]
MPKRYGFLAQSLSDYPGEVCSVVFIPGCNFHCPYCHNKTLADDVQRDGLELPAIEAYLQKARKLISGVCISGGESTLYPSDLMLLIERFKRLGLKVKVDTNGSHPEVVRLISPLVDYIAMDLKTSLERYPQLVEPAEQSKLVANIKASIQALLQRAPSTYEFRTTLARDWVDEAALRNLGSLIHPSAYWYLQRCYSAQNKPETPQDGETIERYLAIAKNYCNNVFFRP